MQRNFKPTPRTQYNKAKILNPAFASYLNSWQIQGLQVETASREQILDGITHIQANGTTLLLKSQPTGKASGNIVLETTVSCRDGSTQESWFLNSQADFMVCSVGEPLDFYGYWVAHLGFLREHVKGHDYKVRGLSKLNQARQKEAGHFHQDVTLILMPWVDYQNCGCHLSEYLLQLQ